MRGLVVACVALVACDDGVAIEVRIPTGIDANRVELFIGKTECVVGDVRCPGIGPPGSNTIIPGEVFEVDNPQQFFVDIAPGTTSVEFRLEGDVELPVVLAVATSVQGPAAIAILQDIDLGSGPRRYVAELEGGAPMLGNDVNQNGFLIWPPDRVPETCIGMQFHGRRVFVVPTDFDCDRVMEPECNQFVNNAIGPRDVPIDEVTCASLHPIADGGEQFCMLGGSPCDEPNGGANPLGCTNRRDICTSQVVCQCNDNGVIDLACIAGKVKTEPSIATRILCSIGMKQEASNPAELTPCGLETLDRAPLPANATDCGVRVGELKMPPQLNDAVKLVNGPLEFKFFAKQDGCSYGLGWTGMLPAQPGGADPPSFVGVTEIAANGRSSLVPLEVHFLADGTCPRDTCIVLQPAASADNVFGCLE